MQKSTQKNLKYQIKYLIIFLFFLVSNAYGIDSTIKAKYPFVLVNDDYDILNEQDLADEFYGTTSAPISDPHHSIYWKCYRTKDITINYRILEYSKDWLEDVADLNINAIDENGIVNQYVMRRGIGVTYCKRNSESWKKLMRDQEHVCIHGNYVGSNEELYNGKKQQIMGWVFNKLKTKSGCNNYFASRDCTGKATDLKL
jgi:hypothetical protein